MRSSSDGLTRRDVLRAGGLGLAGLGLWGLPGRARAGDVVEIRMRSLRGGEHMMFDPAGVLVQPGTRIRWVVESDVHTATAYHPDNDAHALRIPETAEPWNSDYLVNPGDSFEITLRHKGVYDYFCAPHELAGMVGRIIVGNATGPGARPFDYHLSHPETSRWLPVPEAAQTAFPPVEEIMAKGTVPGR